MVLGYILFTVKNMNKNYKCIILLFIALIFVFILPIIPLTLGNSDIVYTFNNENFIDLNNELINISETNTYNIQKNYSIYTDIYNASYSFTNEASGSTPIGWTDLSTGTSDIQVITSLGSHDKVLELNDTDASNFALASCDFTNSQYGSIEFWFRTTDSTKDNQFRPYGDSGRIDFIYFSGSVMYNHLGSIGATITSNTWYHIRMDFECASNGYMGLSADTYYIYVNGKRYGPYAFEVACNNIDFLYLFALSGSGYKGYYDGVGITTEGYILNTNLIPYSYYNVSSNYYEEKYLFDYKNEGVFYEDIDDVQSGWTKDDAGAVENFVHIVSNTNTDKVVEIWDDLGAAFPVDWGIYKSFSLTSDLIDISTTISFKDIDNSAGDNEFIIRFKSSDSTEIVRIRFDKTDTDILSMYYYDGASYNLLQGEFIIDDIQFLSFNLNYVNDICTLNYYKNNIYNETFVFPLITTSKVGLSEIKLYEYLDGNSGDLITWIHDIKIIDNGIPLSEDYSYFVLYNTNSYWYSNHYNLVDFSIEETSSYLNSSIFILENEVLNNSYINDTFTYDTYNVYSTSPENNTGNIVNLYYVSLSEFTINDFIEFSLNIYGSSISDEQNTHWIDYIFNNVDDDSYFYVDTNNRFRYILYTNDNNTEYIRATFSVSQQSTTDRYLSFRGQCYGSSITSLQLAYTVISNVFTLEQLDRSYSEQITQGQSLQYFAFQITDDDLLYTGYTSGFIQNIVLRYSTTIETTILMLNLLSIITPLIIILTPSFAISEYTDRKLFAPIFFIFSIIMTVSLVIPYWIMFVIAIAFFLFLITEKEYFEKLG